MDNPQADVERLIARLLVPVRKMLHENGGFPPFAAYLDTARRVRKFAAEAGDRADQDKLTAFLEEAMRGFAAARKAIATAIVSDVRAAPPGERKTRDCVAFALDHVDEYSVIVLLPYELDGKGRAVFGELFAVDGERRIFS
ncbi:MAG TPA: hypothetical protein PKM25_12495 [Candidatus Ozemobacteraceae bacterium]|nr:hypothetical protein [Candidatus Ozemobacteraceae bacterium]